MVYLVYIVAVTYELFVNDSFWRTHFSTFTINKLLKVCLLFLGIRLCPGHGGYCWTPIRLQLQQAERRRRQLRRRRWTVRWWWWLHGCIFRLPDLRRSFRGPCPARTGPPNLAQRRTELRFQLRRRYRRNQQLIRSPVSSIRRSISPIRSAQLPNQSGWNRSGRNQTGHPSSSIWAGVPASRFLRLPKWT